MNNKRTGTYNHCSKCQEAFCCKSFDKIDNPILFEDEVEKLRKLFDIDKYLIKNRNSYCIKTVDNVCPFYKNGCSIYEHRPRDCRLFPFDIDKIDGKYYLVLYNIKCLSKNVENENIDELINEFKDYAQEYTSPTLAKKVSNLPYKIIKEIKF